MAFGTVIHEVAISGFDGLSALEGGWDLRMPFVADHKSQRFLHFALDGTIADTITHGDLGTNSPTAWWTGRSLGWQSTGGRVFDIDGNNISEAATGMSNQAASRVPTDRHTHSHTSTNTVNTRNSRENKQISSYSATGLTSTQPFCIDGREGYGMGATNTIHKWCHPGGQQIATASISGYTNSAASKLHDLGHCLLLVSQGNDKFFFIAKA